MVVEQTTYENFRYRYDKKGNPYNQGLLGNIGETFCSIIPPSKNDFRSFVLDYDTETVETGTSPSTMRRGFTTSNEKTDIEMGSSLNAEDGSLPLPEILQNFDFDNFEALRFADEGQPSFDPFFSAEQDLMKDSCRTSTATVLNFKTSKAEDVTEGSVQTSHMRDDARESAKGPFDDSKTDSSC